MKHVSLFVLLLFGTPSFAEINIVLMGGPGSGKGTLGHALAVKFGIVHVSAGDILREQVRLGTPLGLQAEGLMAKGDLLPDTKEAIAPLMGLIGETLRAHPEGFVLEGLSRNEFRAREFELLLNSLGRHLSAAILIDVSRETILARLIHRTVCQNCQRSYNVGSFAPRSPNVCDDCGTPLVRRNDDHGEVIARRIEVFETNIGPVLRFYEGLGQLVRLDGEHLDDDAVNEFFNRLNTCASSLGRNAG